MYRGVAQVLAVLVALVAVLGWSGLSTGNRWSRRLLLPAAGAAVATQLPAVVASAAAAPAPPTALPTAPAGSSTAPTAAPPLPTLAPSVPDQSAAVANRPEPVAPAAGFPASALLTAPAGTKVMLVLGSDARPGVPGRSDSMLLAAVQPATGSVRLLSLPRDTWAYIPGVGWDKWNHAYAFGMEALSVQTVQRMLGIRIDYTATISFTGFQRIIDALGGVDVLVDHALDYDDPWDNPPLHIHLPAGAQHLDGVQALQFARYRADNQNDWGRIKRQQQLVRAMLKAALRPQMLPRLPEVVAALASSYKTTLSARDLLDLALLIPKLHGEQIQTQTMTGADRLVDTGQSGRVWYTFPDLLTARKQAAWLVTGAAPPDGFLAEARRLSAVYAADAP